MPVMRFLVLQRLFDLDTSLLDLPGKKPKVKRVQCSTPVGQPMEKMAQKPYHRIFFPKLKG